MTCQNTKKKHRWNYEGRLHSIQESRSQGSGVVHTHSPTRLTGTLHGAIVNVIIYTCKQANKSKCLPCKGCITSIYVEAAPFWIWDHGTGVVASLVRDTVSRSQHANSGGKNKSFLQLLSVKTTCIFKCFHVISQMSTMYDE